MFRANSDPSSDPKLNWVTVPKPTRYCILPSPPVLVVQLKPQLEVVLDENSQPLSVTDFEGEQEVLLANAVVVVV